LPKEKIGIIGPHGSGKSTLVKLLPKFVNCTSGRIFVDKTEIGMTNLKDLRYQMMYLSKEVCLFDGTLRDNIDPLFKKEDDKI